MTPYELQRLDTIEAKLDSLLNLLGAGAVKQPAIKSTATMLIEMARVNPRAAIEEAKRIAKASRKPKARS